MMEHVGRVFRILGILIRGRVWTTRVPSAQLDDSVQRRNHASSVRFAIARAPPVMRDDYAFPKRYREPAVNDEQHVGEVRDRFK